MLHTLEVNHLTFHWSALEMNIPVAHPCYLNVFRRVAVTNSVSDSELPVYGKKC